MIYCFITREWCSSSSSSILYPPTRRKRSEEEQEIPPPPWNERTDISGQKDVAHSLHFLSLGCHLVERWKRRTRRNYKSSSHFLMTSSNPLLTGRKKNTQEKEEVVCDPPTHRPSFPKFLKLQKDALYSFSFLFVSLPHDMHQVLGPCRFFFNALFRRCVGVRGGGWKISLKSVSSFVPPQSQILLLLLPEVVWAQWNDNDDDDPSISLANDSIPYSSYSHSLTYLSVCVPSSCRTTRKKRRRRGGPPSSLSCHSVTNLMIITNRSLHRC